MKVSIHLMPKPGLNLVWALAIALLVAACKGDKPKQPNNGAVIGEAELKLQYDSLYKTVMVAWDAMIADDDNKLFMMKRLLEEVSYTGNFNKSTYDSLTTQIEALYQTRYTMQTMADSDLIDRYDSLSANTSQAIKAFAQNNPEFGNYPLMDELIIDISEADNMVLLYRIKYDNAASDYNNFLATHQAFLNTLNYKQAPTKKALFTLQSE